MNKSEKKTILSHMKKDDKEFRNQIKDDTELKAKLLSKSKKKKSKEKEKEEKNERKERKEKKGK